MKLTFLGTNGWYATKTGNTVCAIIETPFNYIVLDAGDGLHRLDLIATDKSKPIDIFLSHFHLDHTIGLHVLPKFRFKKEIRIFGQRGAKKILGRLLDRPFTASLPRLGTRVTVHDLKTGVNIISHLRRDKKHSYRVTTLPLIHADPCIGFKFEIDGKTVAYCTDTGPCANLQKLGKNADVLIMECAFLPGTPLCDFWPHLNPETAANIAKEAKCKRIILTHLDASRYDTMKKRKNAERVAQKIFKKTIVAADMTSLEI